MDRTEIISKLGDIFKMVIGEGAVNLEDFDDNSLLVEDIGLNSVGILYLVIAIEEFFNIRFDDVGVATFKTLGQVVDYIQQKV